MANYRVSWGLGGSLEVLPDGSIFIQIEDSDDGGLITRAETIYITNALVKAHEAPPRKFCPDCGSSAVTPSRETIYDLEPGSECRGCGWKGFVRELAEA